MQVGRLSIGVTTGGAADFNKLLNLREFLPFLPTFSPMERKLPQYEPMPPPLEASQTFSFQRSTMPSRLSDASFKKQEIGRPRLVPPLESTGVAGMNQRRLM